MAGVLLGYTARRQLSQFAAAIVFFHGSEYALAVAFHGRSNVSASSLLISRQYVVAMTCSLLEYIIEILLFPELKGHWWIGCIGLVTVFVGEVIRKCAIITAQRAFTHTIRIHYEDHHKLITHGVYRFMRHPGYCGFFIWAVGTQVMLCNPICIVAFTLVTWKYFSKRIRYPSGNIVSEFCLNTFSRLHFHLLFEMEADSGLYFPGSNGYSKLPLNCRQLTN